MSKRSSSGHSVDQREIPVSSSVGTTAPKEFVDGKYLEYLANILTAKHALNGSYAIYIFMGDFSSDPSAWATDPNLVGTHAVFAALSSAEAASGPKVKRQQQDSPIIVTASMPLTTMLLAKVQSGELAGMDRETVGAYLSSNLNWRVAMVRPPSLCVIVRVQS